ncbi:MAG: flagellar hook-basal body complex protein FliE [Oscillospiraceae bacterium]|jgi:flagellar hook-basal body complex protein FliE|nr:flagellar hook-basal body complex protein FliE [Oscillospiraceae bacterium]
MSITPLSPISSGITSLFPDASVNVRSETETSGSFADALSAAFDNAEAADKADKYTALELLSGRTDDMSGLLLDAQKAEISLELAIQIRNKVVDAYNDIIKMQV